MLRLSKRYLVEGIKKRKFKIIIPSVYIFLLIVSFILILLFAAFPKLVVCFNMFGDKVCTPTGIYTSIIVSLPGYIVAGNILNKFTQIPIFLSLLAVIIVSLILYFYIGSIIDMLIEKKYTTSNLVNVILYVSILIFVTMLLSLI